MSDITVDDIARIRTASLAERKKREAEALNSSDTLEPIQKLTKDLREAAITLSKDEARFLVDAYYSMQEDRIRSAAQTRALSESGEPHSVVKWLADQSNTLESQIKNALEKFAKHDPVGEWLLSIVGIGPVISAGLLAHIDITKAPTVGHIWRFAGLDPTMKWEKKQKRPWNAALKVICWKAGESFVKTSNHENSVYGPIYRQRKERETEKNERGDYADQAAAILQGKKIGKETEAYKAYSAGKLPPAHIHARACRYAVKLFLSHLHEKMYWNHYGAAPPFPYPIAILGHAHRIASP